MGEGRSWEGPLGILVPTLCINANGTLSIIELGIMQRGSILKTLVGPALKDGDEGFHYTCQYEWCLAYQIEHAIVYRASSPIYASQTSEHRLETRGTICEA